MDDNYLKALFNWNYFCSLCDMLTNTMNYVDHSNIKNYKVYSFEFKKIIMLAASEFESISKSLCKELMPNKDSSNYNIIDITENILKNYKNIKSIKISNGYITIQPLKDWSIIDYKNNKKLIGLKWWPDYNKIKHQSYEYYHYSNLNNAVNAMASLMILEMYYIKTISKENYKKIMTNKPCSYFINPYQNDIVSVSGIELPD